MSYQSSIRNKKNNRSFNKNKEISYKIDNNTEEYGFIANMLGNCRCKVISNSSIECIGTICGSLRKFNKRILIEKGDIVIITKGDLMNNKVIINYKLNSEQISQLVIDNKLNDRIVSLYNNSCCTNTEEKEMDELNYNIEFI